MVSWLVLKHPKKVGKLTLPTIWCLEVEDSKHSQTTDSCWSCVLSCCCQLCKTEHWIKIYQSYWAKTIGVQLSAFGEQVAWRTFFRTLQALKTQSRKPSKEEIWVTCDLVWTKKTITSSPGQPMESYGQILTAFRPSEMVSNRTRCRHKFCGLPNKIKCLLPFPLTASCVSSEPRVLRFPALRPAMGICQNSESHNKD